MAANLPSYPGKLLLFGEHVVVQGAQALAVPLSDFQGNWDFPEADATASYPSALNAWADYLEHRQQSGTLGCVLDLARFRNDLKRGMFFRSSIPEGYGAGSSGALCAALYERYADNPLPSEDASVYPALKVVLGNIESFFHGMSSGADPLVSYLNRPLLFDHGGIIRQVTLKGAGGHLFLLDTGKSRQTGPLVQTFQQWCTYPSFLSGVKEELIPATENAIQCLIEGDLENLYEEFHRISYFQYRFMQEFIPSAWREIWLEAMSEEEHILKLCGAGGGGFVLGLSREIEVTQDRYSRLHPRFLDL